MAGDARAVSEWLCLALPAAIAAACAFVILRDLWRGKDGRERRE